MKTILTICLLLTWPAMLFAQDLPGPAANMQTMPEDSYIIAMDNAWQLTSDANPADRYFNLKSYGLIVYLMNNNVKVKRVIRAGKTKDAIDFSVSTVQIKPTSDPVAVVRDFRAGPFVIYGPDLLRVNIDQLIDNYNNNAGGVSGITSSAAKVKVYKTTTEVDVDIRYDFTDYKAKAAILTDGGNASVHTTYMTLAGIPASNYSLEANNDLAINCFTYASEPHNDYQQATVVNNIKAFVLAGGNFLAQCAAIPNYEILGKFHTSNGITVTNTTPAAVYYPNPDLSMAQFEGNYSIRQGGSCQNWKLAASGSYINNMHAYTCNTNGFVNNASLIGSSAAKLISATQPGGMVFYEGNHSFNLINNTNHLNGMRMYLNALLTPSNCQQIMRYTLTPDCNAGAMKVTALNGPPQAYPVTFYLYSDIGSVPGSVDAGDAFIGATVINNPGELATLYPYNTNAEYVVRIVPSLSCYKTEEVQPPNCKVITLPASLKGFTATKSNNKVLLQWYTLSELNNDGFYVQRLVNNIWKDIAFVNSTATGGNSNNKIQYQYVDESPANEIKQYRVKMTGKSKTDYYSEVRVIFPTGDKTSFAVFPNPSSSGATTIYFKTLGSRTITVLNMAGQQVQRRDAVRDLQVELSKIPRGIYLVNIEEAGGKVYAQKLVVQ